MHPSRKPDLTCEVVLVHFHFKDVEPGHDQALWYWWSGFGQLGEGRKHGAGPQVIVQRLVSERACLAIAMISINTSETKNDKKDGEKGRGRYGHMPLAVARYQAA